MVQNPKGFEPFTTNLLIFYNFSSQKSQKKVGFRYLFGVQYLGEG